MDEENHPYIHNVDLSSHKENVIYTHTHTHTHTPNIVLFIQKQNQNCVFEENDWDKRTSFKWNKSDSEG